MAKVVFSKPQHHRQNFYSEANQWEILGICKACLHILCWSEKAYERDPRNKLRRVLQEYVIDGQLLMAIKQLYCQPKVCARANGKQSKSFMLVFGKGVFCHLFFCCVCCVSAEMRLKPGFVFWFLVASSNLIRQEHCMLLFWYLWSNR